MIEKLIMASLRGAWSVVYVLLVLSTLGAPKTPKKCEGVNEAVQALLQEVKNDLRELLREEIKQCSNKPISVKGILKLTSYRRLPFFLKKFYRRRQARFTFKYLNVAYCTWHYLFTSFLLKRKQN